ncbi:hypothetical protein BKP64_00895 [Marinobacter salinus]|uniref:Hcy-binding domain-containing protein n=1 Tax=Marinobacter salinus TaxID=1874317 RepID=A0A1D9GGW3_9GAMM|nr:homocysteine S-methyltransferase family protein [Marinobacter salinus]AOY86849.1 hypothetical protein BKP64_00895 [Marinobacter salinus]
MSQLSAIHQQAFGVTFRVEEDGKLKSGETLAEAVAAVSPAVYADQIQTWGAEGVAVVGGCCEITPTHIRQIADALAGRFQLIRFSELGQAIGSRWCRGESEVCLLPPRRV